MLKIGIDLGGTGIKGGLVGDDGKILYKTSIPTVSDKGEAALLSAIAGLANLLIEKADGQPISYIGIGVPGHVDSSTGMVITCNNIPFVNTPLSEFITNATGLPCFLGNDANVAALAEVLVGSAKEFDDAVMITLGTGIGSGLIFGNKIYDGCNGSAGELGHISLFPDGEMCNCGRRGCFENYASATALIRITKEAMRENPESKLWQLAESLDTVNGKTAFDAMRLGDETGTSVVTKYIRFLSIGVLDIVNLLYPQAIIFGGGISKEGETLLSPLREIINKECYSNYKIQPTLLIAELGNDAGIIGAAMLGD